MVEKTAIGHSKTISEDTEFIATKQQSSTMVQLYHGIRESSRPLKVYNTKFRVLVPPHADIQHAPLIVVLAHTPRDIYQLFE